MIDKALLVMHQNSFCTENCLKMNINMTFHTWVTQAHRVNQASLCNTHASHMHQSKFSTYQSSAKLLLALFQAKGVKTLEQAFLAEQSAGMSNSETAAVYKHKVSHSLPHTPCPLVLSGARWGSDVRFKMVM